MSYKLLTDKEILEDIGKQLGITRSKKQIDTKSLIAKGGTNHETLSNFFNGNSDIRMTSFIRILRGLGELDKLEALFKNKEEYSPISSAKPLKKRIHKKEKSNSDLVWGDDQ